MKDISSYYVNDYNYVPGKRLNSLVRYQIYLKENGTMDVFSKFTRTTPWDCYITKVTRVSSLVKDAHTNTRDTHTCN